MANHILQVEKTLEQFLAKFAYQQRFVIALSGGIDSMVLAAALWRLGEYSYKFRAIHVNHGLSPTAANFANICRQTCHAWGLPLNEYALKIQQRYNLEERARIARYDLLRQNLHENEILLTAHHQNDQIETVLLQLIRGAGVKGLSAMPAEQYFKPGYLWRPFLTLSRTMIEGYAQFYEIPYVDDPSNTDMNFDRNFIRYKIMPLLSSRWPRVTTTMARSASLCQEAQSIIEEIAQRDLLFVKGRSNNSLSLARLKSLSRERQCQVLRFWITQHGQRLPSQVRLQSILNDLIPAGSDANPQVIIDKMVIRRFQDELFIVPIEVQEVATLTIIWHDFAPLLLPNGLGKLSVTLATGEGIARHKLAGNKLSIRFRQGGERCHPAERVGSHPLKKLMQEWRIPPWQRDKIPLLFCGEELVAVIQYCISKNYCARPHEEGIIIHWDRGME